MFHHRSSAEKKQSQKRNKSSTRTGESRGPVKRVNASGAGKQDRLNTLKQLRQAKKDELLSRKRLGAEHEDNRPAPPKVVALVAFHTQADVVSLKRQILATCGVEAEKASTAAPHVPAVAALPPFAQGGPGSGKPRVLLVAPPRDLLAVLDVAKCADVVLAVLGPHASLEEPAFDEQGYRLLTALKAQGLPVVLGAVRGESDALAMASHKRIADSKKFVARYFASELGAETKLFQAGTAEEIKALVRAIGGVTPKELTWRSDRGYLLAQEAEYSSADGVLCLRGYVRGPGLSCRHLVHLTGYGDFALARIATLADPCPVDRSSSSQTGGERVVDQCKEGDELDLQRLRPYDPTTAEQTWPTAEELGDADAAMMPPPRVPAHKKAAAAAIPKPEGAGDDGSDDAMDAEGSGAAADGDDEGMGSDDGGASLAPSGTVGTEDGWDISSNMTMEAPNAENIAAERNRREEMRQRSQEELEFPDEVDTPLDVPARERFQRYRGLKSFRTSPWDPYEDLPVEYSRIWEFEAFAATARAFRQQFAEDCWELEGGGVAALFCAVYIRGVPPSVLETQPRGVPFVVSNLFPCEQKVSVIHGVVTRHKGYDEPIKSKAELSLHCGFRRLSARTTFSEIPKKSSTCKKYRFLRFLHEGVTACASFYAPVVFPPSRLMMFAQTPAGPELVASGSIDGTDPKRLVIKKIMLTGYPFRVNKAKGVVRFMFFNPADVRWFKPVELHTKKGLRGHITESVGTHGYMKCRFNDHVKQDDTVCMSLYKRVYPKWYPPAWGGAADATPENA
mmetsp:Transcript_114223/g.328151  ORF Transcript_114223/g.328151 Transcript_114223/m.328151 type:complete len:792 (+) Transcript_114223:126-2501(+)